MEHSWQATTPHNPKEKDQSQTQTHRRGHARPLRHRTHQRRRPLAPKRLGRTITLNRNTPTKIKTPLLAFNPRKHSFRATKNPAEAGSAEGKGFEPLVRGYRTTVFKTVTFGRSVNLPLPLSGNVTILEEIRLRSEVGSSVCFIPFGE